MFLVTAGGLYCAPDEVRATDLEPVSRTGLCVTEGALEDLPGGMLGVEDPKMRAYRNAATPSVVEARFTYLGPTTHDVPLASGAMRRQFGLKLRAADPCNLVYAMWRFEPRSELIVSVKRNPDATTSAQCGNRGYRNLKPQRSAALPPIRAGETHRLRAELRDAALTVVVDNVPVWEGSLAPDAVGLEGPVGIRSDNARLRLALRAPPVSRLADASTPACAAGEDTAEVGER